MRDSDVTDAIEVSRRSKVGREVRMLDGDVTDAVEVSRQS
jgi:hypothetical protein